MLTQESLLEIHVLHRQGHSIRAIAKTLHVSRNTVRKYLRDIARTPAYSERADRASKLDPFKPYLMKRIAAAKPDWIPATVLFREIQEKGFTGKEGILKNYIRPFKSRQNEPVARFETAPGHQLQIDFTAIRRGRYKLKGFVATLGSVALLMFALVSTSVRKTGYWELKPRWITSLACRKSCCLIMPNAS